MKSLILSLLVLVSTLMPAMASAQTVYESKGGQGRVFSDRPMSGGRAVDLPPLNVIESSPSSTGAASTPTPTATGAAPAAGRDHASPADRGPEYRLSVLFPQQGGSVAANNATFEVRLAVEPALQLGQGHAFALRLNGRPVPGRFTSTELMIPPEFFGNIPPADVQRQLLEAMVVDANGRTLASAPPVEFQTRFVTVLQNPNRPYQAWPYPRGTGVQQPASPPATVERPARESVSPRVKQTGDR